MKHTSNVIIKHKHPKSAQDTSTIITEKVKFKMVLDLEHIVYSSFDRQKPFQLISYMVYCISSPLLFLWCGITLVFQIRAKVSTY